jgi:hypothetical protein
VPAHHGDRKVGEASRSRIALKYATRLTHWRKQPKRRDPTDLPEHRADTPVQILGARVAPRNPHIPYLDDDRTTRFFNNRLGSALLAVPLTGALWLLGSFDWFFVQALPQMIKSTHETLMALLFVLTFGSLTGVAVPAWLGLIYQTLSGRPARLPAKWTLICLKLFAAGLLTAVILGQLHRPDRVTHSPSGF